MKQRVPTYSLFEKNKSKEFVDRTEIREEVSKACSQMLARFDTYFRVIDIYGIGGVGKTRLIAELKKEISDRIESVNYKLIHVSFEIKNRQQVFENLLQFRYAFNESCPLFDFALMTYWDKSGRAEKLEDKFMYRLRGRYLTELVDIAKDSISLALPAFPPTPSLTDIFDFVNRLSQKLKLPFCQSLTDISKMEPQELIIKMPLFLGEDIGRWASKNSCALVVLCDAYQQSMPYNESKEWLLELIAQIHKGLFIVTGREKLKWSDSEKDIFPYHLQSFSENIAREHLMKYIPHAEEKIVNDILISSQCVPLFLDMAIDVYQREKDTSKLVNLTYFQDRSQLTQRFIYHLPKNWQGIILALSVVKVFNKNIFLFLGKELNYSCSLEDYEDIISTSLFNYVERAKGFVKLHDVFCQHAVKVLKPDFKREIWHYYLSFIQARGPGNSEEGWQEAHLTLFLNLLHCCEELKLEPTEEETEWLLDIFFQITDSQLAFEPPVPRQEQSQKMNDICCFLKAFLNAKVNTHETVRLLSCVCDPQNFGRHRKSYLVILGYYRSILGYYSEFIQELEEIEKQMSPSERIFWYYPHIKMYIADFFLMRGQFTSALERLIEMENEELSEEMRYQTARANGHIYRFNMMLEQAERKYVSQNEQITPTMSSYVYLQTNLCETYCFFDTERFYSIYNDALRGATDLGNLKNQGKLHYSHAIVLAGRGELDKAYMEVQCSLAVNQKDGYKSGELFAYMARAYCDYAKYGKVKSDTRVEIEKLLLQNGVYHFFSLPLTLMSEGKQAAENLREKFDWLDFDYTIDQYDHFLQKLRNVKKVE